MSPKYRLHYFDVMAVAEPIRLIFAYAKVDYEDVRVKKEDWPGLKPTTLWGQLPVLEIDGVPLAQSTAIARYLAKKFDLVGETDMEAAKCDEYVDVLGDIRTEALKFWLEKDESKKEEAKKHFENEVLPKYMIKFTQILEKQGNGFLVGKKLSYADISVAHRLDDLCKRITPGVLDKYPVFKKFASDVLNQPGIKEWIQKRPQTQF